ncbi:MAG: CtsR family transcriptional regulator [Synergistaceae bacterium]|nr:CtsR family transcriptional regulator [Synergistaceae bacterium]MBQ6435493.1 CtsR family transcriptional regulator [Synergistaceae bacterium]MBQ6739013.1 CtsR family transcriptional regulator [Synergistaceae bacterium]MBQ7069404.1 CtsR family transcriptional regulator [Synergistaceae bacterium]MBR0075902.1 CtsR family transcriptional regulator [Synergistaceae bacterium]
MENENLSQVIEQYILDLFNLEQENFITMRRKELAEHFECVPSQINYVLRSRFSPAQGYLIESRRGEYGYIRIKKITCESPEEKISHIEDLIGEKISMNNAAKLLQSLQERDFITARERLLIEISLKESNNPAKLLQKILSGLMLVQ